MLTVPHFSCSSIKFIIVMNQLTSRFLGAYGQLAVADTQLREQANQFLLQLVQTQEAWQVAKVLAVG